MEEIRKEFADMRLGMENSIKKMLDESIKDLTKGLNDKMDSIMERTVTTDQLNDRMNPVEQTVKDLEKVTQEMQQRIKDLEEEAVRQNRYAKETNMSKVLRDQRTRIFIGRVKDPRNQISARELVARLIQDVVDQEKICRMTVFLFDIRQITDHACIITAATPTAACEMLVGMSWNPTVVQEKWRVVPVVPIAPEVKHIVMAVDAILGKLKTMKVVKNWFTSYGIERGVYRVYATVRSDNAREVKLSLKTDIYKNKDSKIDVMNRVAANMLEVATDSILKDCIKEIVEGRAAGAQGGAESGARGRPHEPLQMDTTNNGSPPPPTPKESTPITSLPTEDVINADYPHLPFKDNMGSPSLGLIKVARTGEKTKPEVRHHQTILSASTEEEMDGVVEMEMEKQTDKDKVLQLVKDGNKRGAEALDKSMDRGEIAETEGRKLSAAKKSTGAMLLSKI